MSKKMKKDAERRLFRLKEGFVETVGEKVGEGKGQLVSALIQADDLQLRGEFTEHLAALAAGDTGLYLITDFVFLQDQCVQMKILFV